MESEGPISNLGTAGSDVKNQENHLAAIGRRSVVDRPGHSERDNKQHANGSISSSCSDRSQSRNKLQLHLEMNIKSKNENGASEEVKSANTNRSKEEVEVEPVTVMVNYPGDMVVTVNAHVRKVIDSIHTPPTSPDHVQIGSEGEPGMLDQNGNQVLNSTFIKVPLSSTMIYPIIEENETSDQGKRMEENRRDRSLLEGKSFLKPGSGGSSFYQTVLDGNDGFGNISAIANAYNENHEKASDAEGSVTMTNLHAQNLDFRRRHLSLTLNSKLLQAEIRTPTEKLVHALHVLARYRGSWGIYEDEERIVKHLEKLNKLLKASENSLVHNACCEEEYEEIKGLISYFIKEKRFVIRSELLRTFSILCQKSQSIANIIFESDVSVALAVEIGKGDYTSQEIYDYALYFLQIIATCEFSDRQFENIGAEFYSTLITMIYGAEKNLYKPMAEVLFDVFLQYHAQLNDDTDFKWMSWYMATSGNYAALKKMKQKLLRYILKHASPSDTDTDAHPIDSPFGRLRDVLNVLMDFIISKGARELFTDAELDILVVTLTHTLENDAGIEFRLEALKTIHRILTILKTAPSALDRLHHITREMLTQADASGGNKNGCYRGVLKKIYKIAVLS